MKEKQGMDFFHCFIMDYGLDIREKDELIDGLDGPRH